MMKTAFMFFGRVSVDNLAPSLSGSINLKHDEDEEEEGCDHCSHQIHDISLHQYRVARVCASDISTN